MEWTVEWLIIDSSPDHPHPQQKVLNHHISEKQTVLESFFSSPRDLPFSSPTTISTITTITTAIEGAEGDKVEEREKKTPKRIKANTNFYLVLEAPANKRRCVRLDPHRPWTENLRERVVVEFPQVLVVAPAHQAGGVMTQTQPEGWEVMADTRKIVELKTNDQVPKEGDNIGEEKKLPVISTGSSGSSSSSRISVQNGVGRVPVSNELAETSKRKLSSATSDDISNILAAIKRARTI